MFKFKTEKLNSLECDNELAATIPFKKDFFSRQMSRRELAVDDPFATHRGFTLHNTLG